MQRLWFKAKTYGYGWYPCSWQGWLVTGVYVFVLLSVFRIVDLRSQTVSGTFIGMLTPFIALTLLLIIVCILTGEKARWRWGKSKDKS